MLFHLDSMSIDSVSSPSNARRKSQATSSGPLLTGIQWAVPSKHPKSSFPPGAVRIRALLNRFQNSNSDNHLQSLLVLERMEGFLVLICDGLFEAAPD